MGFKAIIACLKEDRGFVVNERQLKRKIKDWKLEKDVKSDEMKDIVRKIQQRAAIGKNTAFRVRDQPVDPSKIERWQNRCGEVDLNDFPPPSSHQLPPISSYNTIQDLRSPSPYGRNISAGSIDYEGVGSPLPPLTSPSPVVGQINSLYIFGVDVFSTQWGAELFERRSLSPFTALPSPASTLRKLATAPSNLPRTSQNPVAGESPAAGGDVAQAMFQLPQNFQKKRYKQTDELELTQRLDDFQSRYRAADLLFKQGAICLHKFLGENHPRTAYTFSELAFCFIEQGQFSKAEKLFDMMYLKASQIWPSSDRKFLEIKTDFGCCKFQLGDYAAAEQAFREVLAIGLQILPAKDHLIRGCTGKFITSLTFSGQLNEAEKLLSDVMEICASCENVDAREISANRTKFAEICHLQGKHHLAEQVLRGVREIQTLILGREHVQTLATTKDLVRTLGDLGRFIEGEELLRDATKISTKTLGEKHWRTLEMDAILDDLLCKQEKYVEAKDIAMQALRRCVDVVSRNREYPASLLWFSVAHAMLKDDWERP